MLLSLKEILKETTTVRIHMRTLDINHFVRLLVLHQLNHHHNHQCYLIHTIHPFLNQSSRWIALLIITISTTTPRESLIYSYIKRIQIESVKIDNKLCIVVSKHKNSNSRQCCVGKEYHRNHSSINNKNQRNG